MKLLLNMKVLNPKRMNMESILPKTIDKFSFRRYER